MPSARPLARAVGISLGIAWSAGAGCNRDAKMCDPQRAQEVGQALDGAHAEHRPEMLANYFGQVCRTPAFLEDLFAEPTLESFHPGPDAVVEERHALLLRACPSIDQLAAEALTVRSHARARVFFDGCDFQRFGLVDRHAFVTQGWQKNVWAAHQWLLDQGLSNEDARPFSQAVLAFERRRDVLPHADELPRSPFALGPRGYDTALLLTDGEILVPSGGNPTLLYSDHDSAFGGDVYGVVRAHLEAEAERVRERSAGGPKDARLAILAQWHVPWSRVESILAGARATGMSPVGLVLETGAFEHGMVRVQPSVERGLELHGNYARAVEDVLEALKARCPEPGECSSVPIEVRVPADG